MDAQLGARIKSFREGQGLSQDELAQKLKLDRTTLSLLEHGKRALKADEAVALSKILNVSLDQLLDVSQVPEISLAAPEQAAVENTPFRIHVPQKNLQKFKEVLLYILNKVGAKPNVGETVLYKLLYFIDFNYYEKYEEQLIGATYIKNHHGPTPLEFKKIVESMTETLELEKVNSKHFRYLQKKYLPLRSANLALLQAREIAIIDDVLNKLGSMNAKSISEFSHGDVPWITTPQGKKIDYETVFYRTTPYSVREYESDEQD